MVGRTVSAPGEAVHINEVITAIHALPVHEVGTHENSVAEFFVDVLEVLNEIKDQIIVTRVPDVVLDPIVRPLHFEFCDD